MKALASLLLLVLLAAPALAQYYNPYPNPYTNPYGRECEDPYHERESEYNRLRYQQQVQENWYQQQLYEQRLKDLRDEMEMQQLMRD